MDEKKTGITVQASADTSGLDVAIEKAKQLHDLLEEDNALIEKLPARRAVDLMIDGKKVGEYICDTIFPPEIYHPKKEKQER